MRRRDMWMDIRGVHFRAARACEMVFLKAFRFMSNVPGSRKSGNMFGRVWAMGKHSLCDPAIIMVFPSLS